MKTSVSLRAPRMVALLALAFASLSVSTLSAQTSVNTVPVGVVTMTINASPQTTMVGLPMKAPSLFTAAVASVTSNTITFTGTPLVSGGYSSPSSPFYAFITTGNQAGRSLRVTANDLSTITLDITDSSAFSVALDVAGLAVAPGDKIELTPADTLGSLLGTGANVKLFGANSSALADTVGLWNGARFVAYFYHATNGHWVQSGFNSVNENNRVIAPNEGMAITRRGGRPALTLPVLGVVQDHNTMYRHNGASTLIVTQKYPVDITLGSMVFSPGTLVSAGSLALSDVVGIWNGARFVSYYKHTNGNWVTGTDILTNQASVVIPAGTPVSINRRAARTGSAALLGYTRPYADPKL